MAIPEKCGPWKDVVYFMVTLGENMVSRFGYSTVKFVPIQPTTMTQI